jgi:hypothetical protein
LYLSKYNVVLPLKGGPSITALGIDNPKYLKFILENTILSTNAVIDGPPFRGKTTLYLDRYKVKAKGKLSKYNRSPVKAQVQTRPAVKPKPGVKTDPMTGGPATTPGLQEAEQLFRPEEAGKDFMEVLEKGKGFKIDKIKIKGLPKTKKKEQPKLVYSDDEVIAIVDQVRNGDTILSEPIKFKNSWLHVTNYYDAVVFDDENIGVLTGMAEIEEAYEAVRIHMESIPTIKIGFDMQSARKALQRKFEKHKEQMVPEEKVEVVDIQEAEKLIVNFMKKNPTLLTDLSIRQLVKSDRPKNEILAELYEIAKKLGVEKDLEKDCK